MVYKTMQIYIYSKKDKKYIIYKKQLLKTELKYAFRSEVRVDSQEY